MKDSPPERLAPERLVYERLAYERLADNTSAPEKLASERFVRHRSASEILAPEQVSVRDTSVTEFCIGKVSRLQYKTLRRDIHEKFSF